MASHGARAEEVQGAPRQIRCRQGGSGGQIETREKPGGRGDKEAV